MPIFWSIFGYAVATCILINFPEYFWNVPLKLATVMDTVVEDAVFRFVLRVLCDYHRDAMREFMAHSFLSDHIIS